MEQQARRRMPLDKKRRVEEQVKALVQDKRSSGIFFHSRLPLGNKYLPAAIELLPLAWLTAVDLSALLHSTTGTKSLVHEYLTKTRQITIPYRLWKTVPSLIRAIRQCCKGRLEHIRVDRTHMTYIPEGDLEPFTLMLAALVDANRLTLKTVNYDWCHDQFVLDARGSSSPLGVAIASCPLLETMCCRSYRKSAQLDSSTMLSVATILQQRQQLRSLELWANDESHRYTTKFARTIFKQGFPVLRALKLGEVDFGGVPWHLLPRLQTLELEIVRVHAKPAALTNLTRGLATLRLLDTVKISGSPANVHFVLPAATSVSFTTAALPQLSAPLATNINLWIPVSYKRTWDTDDSNDGPELDLKAILRGAPKIVSLTVHGQNKLETAFVAESSDGYCYDFPQYHSVKLSEAALCVALKDCPCPSLTTLRIIDSPLSSDGFAALSNLAALEHLAVTIYAPHSDKLLSTFASMPRLAALHLRCIDGDTVPFASHAVDKSPMLPQVTLRGLTMLQLHNRCVKYASEVEQTFSRLAVPALRMLTCFDSAPSCLAPIARNPGIDTLRLFGDALFTNPSFAIPRLSGVRSLAVRSCYRDNRKGHLQLGDLLHSFGGVEALSIGSDLDMFEAFADVLSLEHKLLPALRRLELVGEWLDPSAIARIAKARPAVKLSVRATRDLNEFNDAPQKVRQAVSRDILFITPPTTVLRNVLQQEETLDDVAFLGQSLYHLVPEPKCERWCFTACECVFDRI